MFKSPVFYLRRNDFDSNGNLTDSVFKKKLTIVFIHANYCSYCTAAKPEYQKASLINANKNFLFAAIQADGNEQGESQCSEILGQITINKFKGYPDYALFIDGKPIDFEVSGRDANSILKSINKYYKLYYK